MSSGDEQEMSGTESSWDETMEMALFYAAIKFKPVGMLLVPCMERTRNCKQRRHDFRGQQLDDASNEGLFDFFYSIHIVGMHKHFRMVNLHKHFNKHSPTPCTIAELWEKLGTMYDLQTLDERVSLFAFCRSATARS